MAIAAENQAQEKVRFKEKTFKFQFFFFVAVGILSPQIQMLGF